LQGIVLYGIKHSGKSYQAAKLSDYYGLAYHDIDHLILAAHPEFSSIRSLYRDRGLEWFSRAEYLAAKALVDRPTVIATGGGSMENDELVDMLSSTGWVSVFLDAPEDVLWDRIARGGIPPFLEGDDPRGNFHRLYIRRRTRGMEVADLTMPTGEDTPDRVFERLVTTLDEHLAHQN
jgi:shikimate kinase